MKPLHFDAINPFTGTPFLWGDSNLRFVDGMGVYLEPGDEGFVPYPGQVLPHGEEKEEAFPSHSASENREHSAQIRAELHRPSRSGRVAQGGG